MFFSIISPQNPPKLVIWNTKIPTREQNFPTNGLLGGRSAPPAPIGFGPVSGGGCVGSAAKSDSASLSLSLVVTP